MITNRNDDASVFLNTSFEMRRLYDVEDREVYSIENGSCFSLGNGGDFSLADPVGDLIFKSLQIDEESILGIGKEIENFNITGIQIFESESSIDNYNLDDENSHWDFLGFDFGVLNTDIVLPQQGAEISWLTESNKEAYAAIQYGLEDNDCRLKVSYPVNRNLGPAQSPFVMDIFEGVVSDEQDHLLYRRSTEEGDFIEHKLTEIDEELEIQDNETKLAIINFNQNSIIPLSSVAGFIFP